MEPVPTRGGRVPPRPILSLAANESPERWRPACGQDRLKGLRRNLHFHNAITLHAVTPRRKGVTFAYWMETPVPLVVDFSAVLVPSQLLENHALPSLLLITVIATLSAVVGFV